MTRSRSLDTTLRYRARTHPQCLPPHILPLSSVVVSHQSWTNSMFNSTLTLIWIRTRGFQTHYPARLSMDWRSLRRCLRVRMQNDSNKSHLNFSGICRMTMMMSTPSTSKLPLCDPNGLHRPCPPWAISGHRKPHPAPRLPSSGPTCAARWALLRSLLPSDLRRRK